MYHCRRVTAINGGSTGAIWGIPVDNRTSFSVGDLVAVFNPVNTDQITQTSRIYEIIPVAKSNAGTIFMQVCGGGNSGIVFSNLIIQEGYELRTITGLVSSTISGPFSTYVDNLNNTVQGRGIIEENYNPTRHELFNYDVFNTAIPTATACKNTSFMQGTPFNTYHFSGVVTTGRVNNAPNTGWNGKSCRMGHMITSQHMIFNGHYPPRSDIAYTVDASGNRQTITRRTPQEVGGNPNALYPYSSPFKNGAIDIGFYPFWFALKNPGLDITDVLDVPFEVFQSFSDLTIQAIKTPVNIIKPKVPFKKTVKLSGNYHNLNSTTRNLKASACLLVQSSFFRGYLGLNFNNFGIPNDVFGVVSCYGDLYNYINKPAWYNNTDENASIQQGDSSSLVFWCFDRNGTITPEILLPLTGLFTGSVANSLYTNATFDTPTFTGLNGTEVTQTFNQHAYAVFGSTGAPGILTENQKKAIEFILKDKSWQITHPNFISANPEKNIYESDIVDTIINWYDVSDPNESLPPITNEQIFSLRSGINLETNNPSFTRFKPEDRFSTINLFNWGTSFESAEQIFLSAASLDYRFNYKGYDPLTGEPAGVPQLHSLPQLPAPAESKDRKLPYIVFRRATSSDVIALESNPNTNVSVFRNGGSLLQNNILTPVDMEFHRSGAKLIKKKLK